MLCVPVLSRNASNYLFRLWRHVHFVAHVTYPSCIPPKSLDRHPILFLILRKILSEYVSCVYACEKIACSPTLQGKPILAHKVARLQNSRYSSTFHRQAFVIIVNSLLWLKL